MSMLKNSTESLPKMIYIQTEGQLVAQFVDGLRVDTKHATSSYLDGLVRDLIEKGKGKATVDATLNQASQSQTKHGWSNQMNTRWGTGKLQT